MIGLGIALVCMGIIIGFFLFNILFATHQRHQVGVLILKLLDEYNDSLTIEEIIHTITVGAAGIIVLQSGTIRNIIEDLSDDRYIMMLQGRGEKYYLTDTGRRYLLSELAGINR